MFLLFTKKLFLRKERGDLLKQKKFKHVHLKTARVSMLSRLMIEQGDLLMTQLQYKTTLKYIMRPERSTSTMKYFVKEWRHTWTSEFQDYHIPLWNTRKVPAFDNWFRKLRTIQIDMPFNKIYDRINHLILSPESKQMIHDVGNIELRELPETEPKTQCTECLSYWNIGILYCTCGHFLHKERGANQLFISYTMDLLSLLEYVIKKGRPHGHRYGKKLGDKEYFTAHLLNKWCKKKYFQRIHNRFIRDPEFRSRMKNIETKNFVDDGMLLRMKITLTIWPHKNTFSIRVNGGFIQISKVPILYDWRRDLISNKLCLPCIDCNEKQKETHKCLPTLTQVNNGHRVLLLHGGIGKVHGGLLILPKVTMENAPSIEWKGVTCWLQYLERFFWTRLSWIQLTLLQMDRLPADSGLQ